MALSAKEKERLDQMSFAKGGGFADFMTGRKKAAPAESKFLFVGLGGKGSKTVAAIKTGVYKKIECPQDKQKPDNFEYLIVDTDKESIRQLAESGHGEVGLSNAPEDLESCQLFDEEAAKKLVPGNQKLIPANIQEWISPTLNAQLQGTGAGGIRQAGRYLLFGENAFNSLENALTLKLRKLYQQIVNPDKEKLIVYVFAGVGGGTGSGTIIDIPYIIREICRRNMWRVKIHAYIFLPDTYPEAAKGNHLRYNSYAALKEIDTLMNIGQMDGAAQFKAEYVPGFSVNSTEPIFDSCVLVSGKKSTGTVPNPDKFTRNVVVDNVINMVTDNRVDGLFLVNSFLDNSLTEIANAVTVLPDVVPRNARYQYLVIGTGEVVLPMEQIMAYLAQGTMERLERGWDKHPVQNDVEELLNGIHMLPEEQAGEMESQSAVSVLHYVEGIGGPVDKKNNEIISGGLFNSIKQVWMTRNVDLYNAWDVAKNRSLERIIVQLDERYYKLFQDSDAGIYFLRELFSARMVDGDKINGICYRLKNEYFPSIDGLIGGQQAMQRQIDMRMAEIVDSLGGVLGGGLKRNALIEEYRELCVGKLVCENRVYMYEEIVRDCMRQIIAHLERKLENLQKYIDVFTYMKEIVHTNYRNVMEGELSQAEYAGRLIDFSSTDDDTKRVIGYLDNILQQETEAGLVSALEDRIVHTERQWIDSTEEFDPMKVFVEFLESRYGEVPNLTLEKFIEIKYGQNNFATGVFQVCQELKSRAEVIFPTAPGLSLSSLVSHRYVVVPDSAMNLRKSLAAFAQANGAAVTTSSDVNSIFWYNLVDGVPLFANADIDAYESLYEKNDISGMHLWESAADNWKDFPALTMPKVWKTPNENPREKEYLNKIKKDTETYLGAGIIKKMQNTGLYHASCFRTDISAVGREQVVEWCRQEYLTAPERNADGTLRNDGAMWERICQRFADEMEEYRLNIPTVYMNVTEENLYEMLRLNVFLYKRMQQSYEIFAACAEEVEQANQEQLVKIARDRNIGRFYDYVRTGILRFDEEAVVLVKKNGEEEEVSYFENYTVLENRFFVYYAFLQMIAKYGEEELEELDVYCEELAGDHSAEAREKYKTLSDGLIKGCAEVRDSLKKLELKKMLKDAGKESMVGEYADFYTALLGKQKGK